MRPRETLVSLLVLAVATILVYSNTFSVPLVFDDLPNIVENRALRDLSGLWPPSGGRWVGYVSFALNYRLGGLDVVGYHAVNLCIHVCNALLVFWLAAVTLRTPAMQRAEAGPLVRRHLPLAAALLFAVHPIATQAVTYVVQRFTSLATLFFLLSLAAYAAARLALEAERPARARAVCLGCLALIAAAGAMRTKEIAFTLPVVAAGYELLFFGLGRRALLWVPLAAVALLLVPIGLDTAGLKLPAETDQISRSAYLLTQTRVVVEYLRLLVLPIGQNLDYDFRLSQSLAEPSVVLALAIIAGVVAGAVWLLVRARKTGRAAGALVFFGVAWLFATLSVESSVIPIRDVIFEHRMYLPSAGAAVALGTALLWTVERLRLPLSLPRQLAVALVFTVVPLGAATWARNRVWQDGVTLWSDVVAKSPLKARPRLALGNALRDQGQLDGAIRELQTAIRLAPGLAPAHETLGAIYHQRGQLDDALRELEQAIRLEPSTATTHYALGIAYDSERRTDDAIREYREAIRLDPGLADVRNNLGFACRAKGRLDEAEREFRDDIQRDPGPASAEAHNNLAGILSEQGRTAEAVEEYRRALALKPLPAIVLNLGRALEAAGRAERAAAGPALPATGSSPRTPSPGPPGRAPARSSAPTPAPRSSTPAG